jgi:hypothetical protein
VDQTASVDADEDGCIAGEPNLAVLVELLEVHHPDVAVWTHLPRRVREFFGI